MAKGKPATEFNALVDKLEERCRHANIPLDRGTDEDGDDFARIQLQNGREKREIHIWEKKHLQRLLLAKFEKYVVLGDYIAIASYDDLYIEAAIRPRVPGVGLNIPNAFGIDTKRESQSIESIKLVDEDFAPGCELEIGQYSNDMLALMWLSVIGPRVWSVKIRGMKFTSHDDAMKLLERVTNSLFFQVDLSRGIALALRRERRLNPPSGSSRSKTKPAELAFPKFEYDEAPITLYWYARSAASMPLLQFLAFYQCIEFYFPTFLQSEARRRIRRVLKDPSFRLDRDTDYTRLLSAIGTNSRGFADERSMLLSTIRECVDAKDIRDHLESTEELITFFSTGPKNLTEKKIPIKNSGLDLRDAAADRIYDLRCKIVHTKSDPGEGPAELLLPYSKEEGLLAHDIALIRFIAQRVLITGSSSLRLQ